MRKILSFKSKEARSVCNLELPETIYCMIPESKKEQYIRDLLGIDNALFISKNLSKGYTVCILDKTSTQVDVDTKVVIASEGKSGSYLLPIVPIQLWSNIVCFSDFLRDYTTSTIEEVEDGE